MSSHIQFKIKDFQKQHTGQNVPLKYSLELVLMNKAWCDIPPAAPFIQSHGLKMFPFFPSKNNPINETTVIVTYRTEHNDPPRR